MASRPNFFSAGPPLDAAFSKLSNGLVSLVWVCGRTVAFWICPQSLGGKKSLSDLTVRYQASWVSISSASSGWTDVMVFSSHLCEDMWLLSLPCLRMLHKYMPARRVDGGDHGLIPLICQSGFLSLEGNGQLKCSGDDEHDIGCCGL
jgi:hypothetical protein